MRRKLRACIHPDPILPLEPKSRTAFSEAQSAPLASPGTTAQGPPGGLKPRGTWTETHNILDSLRVLLLCRASVRP